MKLVLSLYYLVCYWLQLAKASVPKGRNVGDLETLRDQSERHSEIHSFMKLVDIHTF